MIRDTNFIESTEHNIRDAKLQRSKSPTPPPPQQIAAAHKFEWERCNLN